MLGEAACNKRVEAWAARQFRDVRGSVETHRFDQRHKWPSKDARGPAHHFAGRTGSIGQDFGG